MASTQKPVSEKKEIAPAIMKMAPPDSSEPAPEGFKPIEFWNPVFPNEVLYVHSDGYPAEYAQEVRFVAGYFLASKPWQVKAIKEACGGRVYTADTGSQMRCDKCGWATKSTAAFSYHVQQHA